MATKKQKFEVVDYERGGFFVFGGSVGENFFAEKADADAVCDALNMADRLKTRTFAKRINEALSALTDMDAALKEGTGGY